MTRISIHFIESSTQPPHPVLVVNGKELHMSFQEFDAFSNEVLWARGVLSEAVRQRWASLADKYKEVQHANH